MKELQLWIFATGSRLIQLEDWVGELEDKYNDPRDRGFGSLDTSTEVWKPMLKKLFIYPPPAVAFMLKVPGTEFDFELIRGMNGEITKDRLARFYKLVLNNPTPNRDGNPGSNGQGNDPVIFSLGNSKTGNGILPGLNLGFGLNLPPLVWLLLAIGSGVQTLGKGSMIKKGLWGTVSAISAINYINKKYAK